MREACPLFSISVAHPRTHSQKLGLLAYRRRQTILAVPIFMLSLIEDATDYSVVVIR